MAVTSYRQGFLMITTIGIFLVLGFLLIRDILSIAPQSGLTVTPRVRGARRDSYPYPPAIVTYSAPARPDNGFPSQYTFCYTQQLNQTCEKGVSMNTSLITKYGIDIIGSSLVSLKNLTLDQFRENVPMVTGASSNHYTESIASLQSLKLAVKPFKVIYWDLGLNDAERKELSTICGLELRKLDLESWPPHAKVLQTYAWKPILMLMMLKDYPGVMWFDSSVHFDYSDFWEKSYEMVRRTDGIVHYAGGHSSPSKYTDPHMLNYLPTDKERFSKVLTSGEGGVIMYFRTKRAYENVLYWYWLCALTKDCIAPASADLFENKPKGGKHLHRYDQSILGVLNENLFNFSPLAYVMKKELKVTRGHSAKVKDVKWC